MYLPCEPADFGNPVPFAAGPGDSRAWDIMFRTIDLYIGTRNGANLQFVAGGSPLALRLVLRNLPRRPRDHALAGAGSPGLRATRGRSSGELAVLGPLS